MEERVFLMCMGVVLAAAVEAAYCPVDAVVRTLFFPDHRSTPQKNTSSSDQRPGNKHKFCYVNNFSPSDNFGPVTNATPDAQTLSDTGINMSWYVHSGQPFLMSRVTTSWGAVKKWNRAYLAEMVGSQELFSSTFSTLEKPVLGQFADDEVYYGIFLNDPTLAALVARDYHYPDFIPEHWRVTGEENVPWC